MTTRAISADDLAALLAVRSVIADAAGHPGRVAAIEAIDRLASVAAADSEVESAQPAVPAQLDAEPRYVVRQNESQLRTCSGPPGHPRLPTAEWRSPGGRVISDSDCAKVDSWVTVQGLAGGSVDYHCSKCMHRMVHVEGAMLPTYAELLVLVDRHIPTCARQPVFPLCTKCGGVVNWQLVENLNIYSCPRCG